MIQNQQRLRQTVYSARIEILRNINKFMCCRSLYASTPTILRFVRFLSSVLIKADVQVLRNKRAR